MKESVMLLFVVLKNCSLPNKHSGNSHGSPALYFTLFPKHIARGWVPVAHACNPSYSRGRDQKDCDLKLA
jgi:hypothetical protein